MDTSRRSLVAGAATLMAAGVAASQPPQAPVQVWPEVADNLVPAVWAGNARLRFWAFDVYDAQMWVNPDFRASQYAQHGLALSLTYLRALRGKAIAERSLTEMLRQGTVATAQQEVWLGQMLATFVDVSVGDRLTGIHQPDWGARFWLNARPLPAVMDPVFSRRFFGIWLSELTSEPQMRKALLRHAAP